MGCAAGKTTPESADESLLGQRKVLAKAPENDGSRCEFRGRVDRAISETGSLGSNYTNIRRVYAFSGADPKKRRTLICREIDTNFDGRKDSFTHYNLKGQITSEEADTDHDGRLDTWTKFGRGKVQKLMRDLNGDGVADEIRQFSEGQVVRIQRDTNFDGRPDVWEIYGRGRLQRMGVDLDHDGYVDRWDRDEALVRQLEREEAQEAEAPTDASGEPGTTDKAPSLPADKAPSLPADKAQSLPAKDADK